MIKKEDESLVASAQSAAEEKDAKFLVSTLLVYVAKGDGDIGAAEVDSMVENVSRRFGGTGAEAKSLLAEAVKTFIAGGDLIGRLGEISLGLTPSEASDIFNMLLEVIMADGTLADGEVRTVTTAGMILGLSDDAIQAGIQSVR